MGIKLLFFTVFSKFVAHESVAFMLVLFSCYSRCLLIFLGGCLFGVGKDLFQFYLLYGYFVFAFSMLSICF